jgi:hypothetical protein
MNKVGFLLPWFLAALAVGQAQPPAQTPAAPATATQPADQSANRTAVKDKDKSKSQNQNNGTSKDRLFYTLPDFLTLENAGNVPPLSAGEKFKVTARSSFDPAELVWYGALAGIAQAENDEPAYGQGAEGYAQRYAVRFADGTIENFMTRAVFPSLLREDPRYFQLGQGGFWHRTWYAVSRIFITRTDSGHNRFNFSEILGSASAGAISTYSYHLADERNLGSASSVWATQVGWDTLGNVVKEFWPDIRRKIHKPKTDQAH